MAYPHALAAPFCAAAAAPSASINTILQQVYAMIAALAGAGIDKATIEAQIDALIMASPLPIYLKPLAVFFANQAVEAFLAAAQPKA